MLWAHIEFTKMKTKTDALDTLLMLMTLSLLFLFIEPI